MRWTMRRRMQFVRLLVWVTLRSVALSLFWLMMTAVIGLGLVAVSVFILIREGPRRGMRTIRRLHQEGCWVSTVDQSRRFTTIRHQCREDVYTNN